MKVFWSAFHKLTDSEKKQFLIFLTGSSRVPLGGLNINIKYVNVSHEHLPVAHTCFNLLDLPVSFNFFEDLVEDGCGPIIAGSHTENNEFGH